MLRSLLHRAERVIGEEEEGGREVQQVRRETRANEYKEPIWQSYLDIRTWRTRLNQPGTTTSTYHKRFNTLRSLLVRPKDRNMRTGSLTYDDTCKHYVVEKATTLDKKLNSEIIFVLGKGQIISRQPEKDQHSYEYCSMRLNARKKPVSWPLSWGYFGHTFALLCFLSFYCLSELN